MKNGIFTRIDLYHGKLAQVVLIEMLVMRLLPGLVHNHLNDSQRSQQRDKPIERVTGIGPAYSAWEADVLPLNYTRTCMFERSNTDLRLKLQFSKKFTKVL